jgi:hypothetical protein
MKTIFTLFFAFCISSISMATILTVCPNTTYPAQYVSIQAANDAASAGDTIYIYPATYQVATNLTKRLILIGPGVDPHRPVRLTATMMQPFHLTVSDCSGSIIMGITFNHEVVSGDYSILINDLTFTDCRFNNFAQLYGNNILVENCILYSTYSWGNGFLRFGTEGAYGNIIQNNYIHGPIGLQSGTYTIIQNNIFGSGDANSKAFMDMTYGLPYGPGVQIRNNIFYKSNPVTPANATNDCAFINNIYYLTSNPVPVNLLSSGNVNTDPLFVNFPAEGAIFSFSYDYHLQPTSPGINYGTDGNDIGMWGGPVPVNAGFEPPIPRITELKLSNSTVPVGGTLQMTFKATKAL